jgi:outer membrane biosynthesis protein TonB
VEDTRQLQLMIFVSVLAHIVIIGTGIFLYTFRSQAIPVSLPKDAQIVELYEMSEIPAQETEPVVPEPQEEQVVALQDISEEAQSPTPTPTPTPTPITEPTPTPKPILTPTPKPRPTPTPEEQVVALKIPRRKAVIPSWPSQEDFSSPVQKDQQQDKQEQISDTSSGSQSSPSSRRFSDGPPMTFETESEFPYPEYLEHIREKIEGLWFPEGKGTVSIYLIIERNGKILQSGVDKGTGVGVNKLRESIIRAIALIKRFHPLPEEYDGMALRVRIVVRR